MKTTLSTAEIRAKGAVEALCLARIPRIAGMLESACVAMDSNAMSRFLLVYFIHIKFGNF